VRIGLLATGGTIISATEAETGTVRPSLRVEWLVNHTGLPAALAFADVDEHLRVDSRDLTPQQMLGIATRTREVLRERELDGLVVTHGSDALEETSLLCDLLVDGDQAIVFTAAMRLSPRTWLRTVRATSRPPPDSRATLTREGSARWSSPATRSTPPAGPASRTPSGSTP
jgi:L-asparaginase